MTQRLVLSILYLYTEGYASIPKQIKGGESINLLDASFIKTSLFITENDMNFLTEDPTSCTASVQELHYLFSGKDLTFSEMMIDSKFLINMKDEAFLLDQESNLFIAFDITVHRFSVIKFGKSFILLHSNQDDFTCFQGKCGMKFKLNDWLNSFYENSNISHLPGHDIMTVESFLSFCKQCATHEQTNYANLFGLPFKGRESKYVIFPIKDQIACKLESTFS